MVTDTDILTDHMKNCLGMDAALVVDGDADDIIGTLVRAGWVLSERTDYILGKRIRILTAPGA